MNRYIVVAVRSDTADEVCFGFGYYKDAYRKYEELMKSGRYFDITLYHRMLRWKETFEYEV